uniref:Uncharacterized protein n=1 Tax=Caenorhabditis japonica TaxID=281687 RepID=A0A8R1I003_CAEJA
MLFPVAHFRIILSRGAGFGSYVHMYTGTSDGGPSNYVEMKMKKRRFFWLLSLTLISRVFSSIATSSTNTLSAKSDDQDEQYHRDPENVVPEETERELLPMERLKRAFGRNDYLLPENFKTLRRADIPVTYRLHDDLLRYYRFVGELFEYRCSLMFNINS